MNEHKLLNQLFDELWPLDRSITGKGIADSFSIIQNYLPLEIEKTPSGKQIYDWEVPLEWHLTSAKLFDPYGNVICDSTRNNLEVVNYSEPINAEFDLDELLPHLHSIPRLPEAIPYVTSYYKKNWGFCMPDKVKQSLTKGKYKVEINTKFINGNVLIGQCEIKGLSKKEILLTSYICHPSLANNELSGPLVLVGLFNRLKKWENHRFTYRFLLNPETIGALCYIHKYERHLRENLHGGLVLTCLGGKDVESLRYKASRLKDSHFNYLMKHYSNNSNKWIYKDFSPLDGSDERQYCSPGFNFPVGQIARDKYGYDKDWYHTSLDTKENMDMDKITQSINQIELMLKESETIKIPPKLEKDFVKKIDPSSYPINLFPYGEPQLGKRNLYPNVNSSETKNNSTDEFTDARISLNTMLTILNLSDGEHSLLEIASVLKCDLHDLEPIIEILKNEGLIAFNIEFGK